MKRRRTNLDRAWRALGKAGELAQKVITDTLKLGHKSYNQAYKELRKFEKVYWNLYEYAEQAHYTRKKHRKSQAAIKAYRKAIKK